MDAKTREIIDAALAEVVAMSAATQALMDKRREQLILQLQEYRKCHK